MVAGIRVQNVGGTTQIDETYKNLCLTNSGTLNPSLLYSYNSTFQTYSASIAFTGKNPLVGFCASQSTILKSMIKTSSTTFEAMLYSRGSNPIDYYIFDSPDLVSELNYGIKVMNESGETIFHTNAKPLRVVGFLSEQWSYLPTSSDYFHEFAPERKYAVISSLAGVRGYEFPGTTSGVAGRGFYSRTDGVVSNDELFPTAKGTVNATGTDAPWSRLIADVLYY